MTSTRCDHCDHITKARKLCGRCQKSQDPTDGAHWAYGWPLQGMIDIQYPAQIFAALHSGRTYANEADFDAWHMEHPAVTVNQAQRVRFEWAHDKPYALCNACQTELLATLGRFFRYGEAQLP